jgi:hypothetical protein
MTQRELNRKVARATGESVEMIERRGFGLLGPLPVERDPLVIDWDEHDDLRRVALVPRRGRLMARA